MGACRIPEIIFLFVEIDKIAGFCSGIAGIELIADIELLFERMIGDIVGGRGCDGLNIGFFVECGLRIGLDRFIRFLFINLYIPTPIAHSPIAPRIPPSIIEPEMIPDCSYLEEIESAAAAAAITGRKSVAVLVAVALLVVVLVLIAELLAMAVILTEEEQEPDNESDGLDEGEVEEEDEL